MSFKRKVWYFFKDHKFRDLERWLRIGLIRMERDKQNKINSVFDLSEMD